MTKEIVVFSKPACGPCTAVKRWLSDEKRSVSFTEKTVTDEENRLFVVGLGYSQTPITILVDGDIVLDSFYGFDIPKLEEFAEAVSG